jgi:hypothetical protein
MWILNRAMKNSEWRDVPVIVRIEGKGSVNVDVFIAAAAGVVAAEVIRLTADDLYAYVKRVIERARKKRRKVEVTFNDQWKERDLPYQ